MLASRELGCVHKMGEFLAYLLFFTVLKLVGIYRQFSPGKGSSKGKVSLD